MVYFLFATVLISRTNTMFRQVSWFNFNLQKENQFQSFTKSYSYYNGHTCKSFFSTNTNNLYILERLVVVSTATNESILVPLSKQTEYFIHQVTWATWVTSNADGLAWLFPAWLAQILLLIKVPNSSTYKSHRYTSQLKQHVAQHSNNTHSYCCSLHIHTGELKRPLLGPNTSVGHTFLLSK
jgi:hypothetical protein